jgi:hypothetical protein
VSNKWEYCRPKYADRNVVAYHPTLLLLWGTHMLGITSSHWSHYSFKYLMKCEPHGCIKLDTKSASRLGLQNISPLQLILFFTLITSKLISPIEVALTCIYKFKSYKKSIVMKYIDNRPPHLQKYYQNEDF